jgi:hypothetical protein
MTGILITLKSNNYFGWLSRVTPTKVSCQAIDLCVGGRTGTYLMKKEKTMINPELFTIRQKFSGTAIRDIEAAVSAEMQRSLPRLKPGMKIALAVGSRGIADLDRIVRTAVSCLRGAGARPFIVPAMGSHGGATAEGQARVLAGYGITEERAGAPVAPSMETVELQAAGRDNRVFMGRVAYEADAIVLVNRIKPHTDFRGRFESGLAKMAAVGLGKHAGALELHSFGAEGLRDRIPRAFGAMVKTGKILLGIAIVENALDETAVIEAIPGERIAEREPELLDLARKNMPRLPSEDIDVLIVDRMGKEISGVGMDPNIIGRIRIRGVEEPASPRIKAIVVSALTPHSYGNAIGIGLADVITRKLYEAIDYNAMYVNARTSRFLERVKVPFVAENDADAFHVALGSCGAIVPAAARVVRIRDTLHLAEAQVSKAIFDEIKDRVDCVRDAAEIFDKKGNLLPIHRDI